jgi:uncharacterized protein (DUF58 family)
MKQASPWYTVQVRREEMLKWGICALVPVYLFTPIAMVQFLCILFILILISSRLYTEYLIRNIRVIRQDFELRVFRYEWAQVELKLENRGLLPAFMLVLGDTSGSLAVLKFRKIIRTLGRRTWTMMSWQGYCADRGVFTLGPAVVRCADPLGLFPFQLTAAETSLLYVYPVLCSINLKRPAGIPLGNMLSPNPLYEDVTRCRSLRPYTQGDELRRVNWKVSARLGCTSMRHTNMQHSGGFMVNEYEATASYPIMIFLNADRDEYPLKKQGVFMERAIEAAAALCLNAARERQELGIIFYTSQEEGGTSVIAPSAFTLVPILERLAALKRTTKSAEVKARGSALAMLEQGKHLSYGTRFLYTGPDLGDEAYISLSSLKRYHLSLEYLIIDDRAVPSLVPGNSPRYKIKEDGREII